MERRLRRNRLEGRAGGLDDGRLLVGLQTSSLYQSMILLYEIHDIRRFETVGQFLSYARPRQLSGVVSPLQKQARGLGECPAQILNGQYNLPPFPKKLSFAANRAEMDMRGGR